MSQFRWSRCIAIHLSNSKCPNRATVRWHLCREALLALRAIAFKGCLRAMVSWLCNTDIPSSVKIRELCFIPWKLARFVLGQTDEAAILDWSRK
jgi:hypothetical protein